MITTVASVLAYPIVQKARPQVLGGASYLSLQVRWLHISDSLNPTGLLKGGELILSSGAPFSESVERGKAYLELLDKCGASGVAVSLLDEEQDTRNVLTAAAQGAKVPVIILENRVQFVELTQFFYRILLEEEEHSQDSTSGTYRYFDGLDPTKASPAEILQRASEILFAPIVYEDLQNQVILVSSGGVPVDRLLSDWQARSRAATFEPAFGFVGPENWLQAPYSENGRLRGRLVIPTHNESALAAPVLDRACQMLEHVHMYGEFPTAGQNRARVGLFHELRLNHENSEAQAIIQANASGLPAAETYLPIVITHPEKASSDSLKGRSHDDDILQATYQVAKQLHIPIAAAKLGDGSIGILVSEQHLLRDEADIQRYLGSLEHALTEGKKNPGLRIALGQAYASITQCVVEGINEARITAMASKTLDSPEKGYYTSQDVLLHRLLWLLKDNTLVREFVDGQLSQLKDVEAQDLEILKHYVELNGNIAELARSSYLSRPSIYKRIKRIEETLRADLSSVDTQTSLYIALIIDSFNQ